jgi:histidinol-phosphate aminotransferase
MLDMLIKDSITKSNRPHWSGLAPRVEKINQGWFPLDRNENADTVYRQQLQDIIKNKIDLSKATQYEDYLDYYTALSNLWNIPTDSILITGGCDEAIRLSFEAGLAPGKRYLSIDPTYRGAETNAVDLEPVFVKCTEQTVEQSLTDVDVFYWCTPNNPSGTVYSADFVESQVKKYNKTLFFIDNTYDDFTQENYHSLIQYPNVLIGKSFSKSWGLAGQRMGALLGHPDLIQAITNIRPIMSVSSVTLQVVKYLTENYSIVQDTIDRNTAGIEYIYNFFSKCNVKSQPYVNHIVCQPPQEFLQLLENQKLLVADLPDNYMRMTTMPVQDFKNVCLNTFR